MGVGTRMCFMKSTKKLNTKKTTDHPTGLAPTCSQKWGKKRAGNPVTRRKKVKSLILTESTYDNLIGKQKGE